MQIQVYEQIHPAYNYFKRYSPQKKPRVQEMLASKIHYSSLIWTVVYLSLFKRSEYLLNEVAYA